MSEVENAKQKLSLALKNLQEKVNAHVDIFNSIQKRLGELQSENSVLKQQVDFLQRQKSLQGENITESEINSEANDQEVKDHLDDKKSVAHEDVDLSINQLKGLLGKEK